LNPWWWNTFGRAAGAHEMGVAARSDPLLLDVDTDWDRAIRSFWCVRQPSPPSEAPPVASTARACYPPPVPSRSVIAALAFAAACALRAEDPPEPPARPLEAKAGDRFALTLESNPATGYRWYLDRRPDPNVVRMVSSEYRPSPQPLAGAPGTEVWTFEAYAPGSATLAFEYRRPWGGKDAPVAERRRYTVKVVLGR
jgi:inhibitor of cysteine peptidase